MYDYYKQLAKFPILTREQEIEICKKIEKGCQRSREKLVNHNLRLAYSIANKYSKTKCSFDDLIAEANCGLVIAVDKYDYKKGFKFSTYATHWIRQRVLRYIGNNGMLKFSSKAKIDLYQINSFRNEFIKENQIEPTFEEIADFTGLEVLKIQTLLNGNKFHLSLEAPYGSDEDSSRTFGDTIKDESAMEPDDLFEASTLKEKIRMALKELTPLEERVLRLRFGISEE